jgi:hypothetical protein
LIAFWFLHTLCELIGVVLALQIGLNLLTTATASTTASTSVGDGAAMANNQKVGKNWFHASVSL